MICVTICKQICTLSMLHAHFPLAFILITVAPCVHSISICLSMFPASDIRIELACLGIYLLSFPSPHPMSHSFEPLSIIDFTRLNPRILTHPTCLPELELTLVYVSCWISLVASPMSLVIHPFTFVDSTILILHYSFALS